ncbi:MAG: nucleoside kinase [Deltaproteobacteria bacterium]|nr:nucleoside kinase [Deltaproteobacteria bacterium]
MTEKPSFEREYINVVFEGKKYQFPRNHELHEFLDMHGGPDQSRYLAAVVNNRVYGRSYPLRTDAHVEPVTRSDRLGWDVYRRSACLMLYEAARRVAPNLRLVLSQTLGDGYYFYDRSEQSIGAETIDALNRQIHQIVNEDLPFRVRSLSVIEARKLFSASGYDGKVHLLTNHWEPKLRVVWCGEFFDLFHTPVAYSTGVITTFRIEPYSQGLVLRFARRGESDVVGRLKPQPKLFATYQESRQWNQILGISNIGELNDCNLNGNIDNLILAADGFHEKKIVSIADEICSRKHDIRLVLIAGPSSSGKTTFSKRLGVQLRVNGVRPVALSTDDFFVERNRTPKDKDGNYDFESIDAIDLDLLQQVLVDLMTGKQVLSPTFDFHAGRPKPKDQWRPMRLEPDQVLVIEGIHGLNEKLTKGIPSPAKFKIYISALTQMCIDDHNRIFTSDTRLLRRIVRDRRYRGYSAAETIHRWPSVRRGENQNIFPYQEQADVMFNSALVYEHAVLKPYAQRYLLEVSQDDPAFVEAYRLLRFLRLIVPVFRDSVPSNSILREFVGESIFRY